MESSGDIRSGEENAWGEHYNHAHVAQRHLRAEDTVGSEGRTQGEFYGNRSWFNQQKSLKNRSS